jgi:hypothetical protein
LNWDVPRFFDACDKVKGQSEKKAGAKFALQVQETAK